MKKHTLKTSVVLLLLIFPILVTSAIKINSFQTYDDCSTNVSSFQGGELLKYKVYYNWKFTWIAAGLVEFAVKDSYWNNEPALHTKATGKTLKAYEWFYKVHDEYESFLNPETFKPVHFIRNVDEGGFTINCDYDFDHENGEVYVNYRKNKGEIRQENESIAIDNCTYDMLSAIYFTRNIDYAQYNVGDVITVEVFMDGKLQEIHIQYGGIEMIKTKLGRFECVMIHPTLQESYLFEGGKKMTVYATNDANRVPVMIEAPLRVGSVKAMLTDHENLSYALTAQKTKK